MTLDELIVKMDKITALLVGINAPIGVIGQVATNVIKLVRGLGGPEVDLSVLAAMIRRQVEANAAYEAAQIARLEAELAAMDHG